MGIEDEDEADVAENQIELAENNGRQNALMSRVSQSTLVISRDNSGSGILTHRIVYYHVFASIILTRFCGDKQYSGCQISFFN